MTRLAFLAAALVTAASLLSGCAGVPLTTSARMLAKGNDYVIRADPAQLRIALNVDARIKAAAVAPPVLHLVARTDAAHPAPDFVRDIPLVAEGADPAQLGLPATGAGRAWMIYGLDAAGARQMAELQQRLAAMRAGKQKGTLAIGVRIEGVAEAVPQYATTRIETWMRVAAADGFFELWSGRIADAATKRG
ncbi:MAG: hypothetical protein IPM22_17350 [Betaproteobacteria bacterium]|nr:hypothetical protein [Betaproteobacteria bacterium]